MVDLDMYVPYMYMYGCMLDRESDYISSLISIDIATQHLYIFPSPVIGLLNLNHHGCASIYAQTPFTSICCRFL